MDGRHAYAKGAEAYRGLLKVFVDCNHPAGGGTEEGRLADGHQQRRAAEAMAAEAQEAEAKAAVARGKVARLARVARRPCHLHSSGKH